MKKLVFVLLLSGIAFGSYNLINKKVNENEKSFKIFISKSVEKEIEKKFNKKLFDEFFDKYEIFSDYKMENLKNFDLVFSSKKQEDSEIFLNEQYVLVTYYTNIVKNISNDDFSKFILSEKVLKNIKNEKTNIVFKSSSELVEIFNDQNFDIPEFLKFDDAINEIVQNKNSSIATIIPLSKLRPELKVITIENVSPFGFYNENKKLYEKYDNIEKTKWKDWTNENYKLANSVWISGKKKLEFLNFLNKKKIEREVFYSNQVIEIDMTGVTAMGRVTFNKIKQNGTDFVSKDFKEVLQNADVAHTSNEVSFKNDCKQPLSTMSFCSDPSFIKILLDLGIDVVELTGNHNNDYGSDFSAYSIKLYEENFIKYFGGGKNLEDAKNPAFIDVLEKRNSCPIESICNKIFDKNFLVSFIGFNTPGPNYALATETESGANPYSNESALNSLEKAKSASEIIIAGIQWQNENYTNPSTEQIENSELLLKNGADLVVGSQGHGFQGIRFVDGKPVFYALGNFIFDQMFDEYVKSGFVLRTFFIDGELKTFELIPYKLYDFASPRFVDTETEYRMLEQIYEI
ncbi:MAG: hypothetical protein Fur0024_1820 [Patescibacteria group bacterium]